MQESSVNANCGTFPRKNTENVRNFLFLGFFCRLRAHFDKETFCKRWYISSKKIRRCHVQLSRHFLSIYFWHNTSSFLITKLFANVGTYPQKIFRKCLSLGASFQFICRITKLYKNPVFNENGGRFPRIPQKSGPEGTSFLSFFWRYT